MTAPLPDALDAACPVPVSECPFVIGQPVHMADPYAEGDPTAVFYVTGINWEHRMCPHRGWNITVASRVDIEKGYGQTDGFDPSDLRASLASPLPAEAVAAPVARVIIDNQPGYPAAIEVLSTPPTLAVGTELFAAPAGLPAWQTEVLPLEAWTEEDGAVLWWKFPVEEPPYVGTPLDCGFTVEAHTTTRILTQVNQEHDPEPVIHRIDAGGWPGYHTHWTRIVLPTTAISREEA